MQEYSYSQYPSVLYYFFVYSSFVQSPQPIVNNESTSSTSQENPEQDNSYLSIEKIIITKEDLMKETKKQPKKAWNQEEDRILLELCKDQNARFKEIASKMPGRNSKMCYSRYRRLNYRSKQLWSEDQNKKIIQLVKEYGDNKWTQISFFFKGKTKKQVKDHYQNYLKPDLNRNQWSIDEDLQLIRLLNLHGKEWKIIEEAFPDRSKNQIKNRYFGKIMRMNTKKIDKMGLVQSIKQQEQ